MRKILKTILLAGTLLVLGIAQAQQVAELAKHPGDVLKFNITFSGPDAVKVKQVGVVIRLNGGISPNQVGFQPVQQTQYVQKTSTGVFMTEIKIDDTLASGEYHLEVIAAPDITGSTTYVAGREFQLHTFHIDNPRTFSPPKIDVQEVH